MPGKDKRTAGRVDDETVAAVPPGVAQNETKSQEPVELTDLLAIAYAPPVPVRFFGKNYSIKHHYTSAQVLSFFDLAQQHQYKDILKMLICEGDPEQFWDDMKTRSAPEMLSVYLPNVYRAAGLMNAQGEFLAL
ncbi:hypothetical protein CH300_20175 [Rhodococcus sp. 15-1154-1]|nr:hypothetical protein [Rhodococcus sp. 15-1154-1]OZF00857.1 hypothetical protein CH300_20175 [Rhodococcus sp. 15-1154-1]